MPVVATCVVSGTLVDGGGNPLVGSTVKATPLIPETLGSYLVADPPQSTVTDSSGNFSLTLARGSRISWSIPDAGYDALVVSIPNQGSVNFSALLPAPVVLPPVGLPPLVLNVMAYGAKGDGVNDDSTGIQAALNAVPVGGAVVYFPAGTYILHASWLRIMQAGTVIRGAGRDLVLLKSTKTAPTGVPSDGLYGLINSFSLSNILIEGIALQGTVVVPSSTWFGFPPLAGAAEKGLYIVAALSPTNPATAPYSNVRVSRCRISNVYNEAFYASGVPSSPLCDRVEFSDNEAIGCASNPYNFNAGPAEGVTSIKILRNTQINCAGGIQVGGVYAEVCDNRTTQNLPSGATWILAIASYNRIARNTAQNADISNGGVAFIEIGNVGNPAVNVAGVVEENLIIGCTVNADGEAGMIDVASASGGPLRIANNTIIDNAGNTNHGHVGAISVQATVASSMQIDICDNYISAGQVVTNPQTEGIKIATGVPSPNNIRVQNNRVLVATPLLYQVRPLISDGNASPTAVINVKDHGAKGDGIADDSGAIQAALNAVPVGGGLVYLPPGTYTIGTYLQIKRSGTYIRGAGRDLTLIKSTVASPDPLINNGLISSYALSQITIEDLALQGVQGPVPSHWGNTPIFLGEKGFFFTTLVAPPGNSSTQSSTPVNDIRVSRCRVSNVGGEAYYFEYGGSTVGNYCEFSFNEAINCFCNTFNVNTGTAVRVVQVNYNRTDTCHGGVQVGGRYVEVIGNQIRDSIANTATLMLIGETPEFIVANNEFFGCDVSDASVAMLAVIGFGSPTSGVVQGNVFADCKCISNQSSGYAAPLHVDVAEGPVRVTGNSFYNINSGDGTDGVPAISVGATYTTALSDYLIDNNYIIKGPSGHLTHGIRLFSALTSLGSNKIRILNNANFAATPKEYNGVTPFLDS